MRQVTSILVIMGKKKGEQIKLLALDMLFGKGVLIRRKHGWCA